MNNRGYRRRKRRITGRFYAFLTVVVVLAVMVGVLIANRSGGAPNVPAPVAQAQPTAQPVTAPAETVQPSNPATIDDSALLGSDAADQGTDETDGSSSQTSVGDLLEIDVDAGVATGDEAIVTNDLSVTPGLSPDWRNILLLGSDSRKISKVSRTDTIMIASINTKTGHVKLTSIMRDLVVPITNNKGVTKDMKINSAVYYGGPQYVMKLVNQLFGMNITEYVLVNFSSFQKIVDILGGVRMDVTQEEMDEINSSLGEQAKSAGYTQEEYLAKKDSMTLKSYGSNLLLSGIQALGYARIRHVGGGDYQRTDRQRSLLDAILKGVKSADAVQLFKMATSVWGEIQTNIDMMSGISIATSVIKNGAKMDSNGRIPGKNTFKSETRKNTSALWDCDFEANKQLLYTYIYGS